MIVTLTYRVDVSSTQKATALRDQIAALLANDKQVTVLEAAQVKNQQRFKVAGVEVNAGIPFIEEVDADTPDQAKQLVESDPKGRERKVVAWVGLESE